MRFAPTTVNMKTVLAIIFPLLVLAICAFTLPQQSGLKASKDRGKVVYDTYCLACHMQDGGGAPRMNPPLIKTKFVLGDKKKLIGIVMNGLSGVEVDGEDYSNVMAPHNFLTDQQIADVLTYVRNSFGNKASAVAVAEVKAARPKK